MYRLRWLRPALDFSASFRETGFSLKILCDFQQPEAGTPKADTTASIPTANAAESPPPALAQPSASQVLPAAPTDTTWELVERLLPEPSDHNALVRSIFDHLMRGDAEFDAFCLDYFPSVRKGFTHSMERTQKISILLERVAARTILAKLHRAHNDRFAQMLLNYLATFRE